MLTYEHFVAVLLGSVERAGLNVAYTQELIDTHALGRSLTITCLPEGDEDDRGPQEPSLRATISFRWSPEFTIFSLRGGDSLGDIERLVDERLATAQSGPSLDIEVRYALPLLAELAYDLAAVMQAAHGVQELQTALTGPDRAVRVETVVALQQNRTVRVSSLSAQQIWSVDEALYDADLLSDTFDELCAELHDLLEALAVRYVADDDARPASGDEGGERRYLKPPTA
ncbi:MAG: hypothetical protein H7Y32_03310 [Chloroflexales bacterium]|nr:hypothetical protein [Chloroflexales bacterium]